MLVLYPETVLDWLTDGASPVSVTVGQYNSFQSTPLKGQRFETLAEAQAYLDRWEEHWAGTRIHGTTQRQVAAMFAKEKPTLLPLPLERFRYYQYGERAVHMDGCVFEPADSLPYSGDSRRITRKLPPSLLKLSWILPGWTRTGRTMPSNSVQ